MQRLHDFTSSLWKILDIFLKGINLVQYFVNKGVIPGESYFVNKGVIAGESYTFISTRSKLKYNSSFLSGIPTDDFSFGRRFI